MKKKEKIPLPTEEIADLELQIKQQRNEIEELRKQNEKLKRALRNIAELNAALLAELEG